MNKVPICLVLFTFLVFISLNAFPQGGFSVHAGSAIPLGDFGDDYIESEDAGGAGTGISLGGKYHYQLNEGGLSLYLGASLSYNDLKWRIKDDYKKGFGTSVDLTYCKFFNIPVTSGLNYTCKANESVSLFGEMGLGIDFLKITSMKLDLGREEVRINYKTKPQVAFELGGGLLFQDGFIIELHYCALGKHSGSSELEYNGRIEELGDFDVNVSLLTVSFGYRF